MGSSTHPHLRRGRSWLVVLLVAGLGNTLSTHAADDRDSIADLEQKLDQSLELIRELSTRVRDLEAQVAHGSPGGAAPVARPAAATPSAPSAGASAAQATTATPAAVSGATAAQPAAAGAAVAPVVSPAPNVEQRLTEVENTVNQMAASSGQHAEDTTGLPMHGFADVGVGNHNAEFSQYKGFDIAELDFFLTPRLGPRTRALFELNFEVASDGTVGVDLERAQLGYQFSDSLTVWMGRFHTPYGFYNTAFHHGQQIATSLRRPRFIEFEDHGGIMPAHTVGIWLTGSQRLGNEQLKLTYDAYIGNAQRITGGILDMNNAGNPFGNTIEGGNLGLLFGGALTGLKIGVDAFLTRIEDQDVTPSTFTQVRSYGVYAAYDTDSWEDIAEFHVFDNEDLSGHTGTHHSDAGFVQLAYRSGFRFTPYGRYERGSFQQSDPYFAAQVNGESYDRFALGLRFDIDLVSCLKLELAETHITDRVISSYDEALLQYAIRF
jgi:hypothetical protein